MCACFTSPNGLLALFGGKKVKCSEDKINKTMTNLGESNGNQTAHWVDI